MIFAVEVKSLAGQRVDWRRWAPPRGAPVATVPSPGTGFPLKVKPLQKLGGGGGGGGGGGTASPLPYVQDEELVIPVSVVGAAPHGREETPAAAFFLLGGVDQHSAAAGGLVSASPAVHLFFHRDEASWGRQRCDSPSYQNASPRPLQFHRHSADGRWGRHAPVLQRALQRTRQYQVQGRAVAAAAAAESTHRRNRPASRDGKNHPQHSELEKCTFHTEARNCFLEYFSPLAVKLAELLRPFLLGKTVSIITITILL